MSARGRESLDSYNLGMEFSLDVLSRLMRDSAVRGLSITRELQPLGGRGDAVSPPTFAQAEGDEKGPRYVWSERRIADETVKTCLLDSPASQANRIEESLLALVQSGNLSLPVHRLHVPNLGTLTDLELPHRTYDAAVGTAKLADGTRWADSTVAKKIRGASRKNAAALLEHAPLILVLGGWDSHSGMASNAWQGRHEKAVWSKVVAIDAFKMNRPGGRLDPMGLPSSDKKVNLSDSSEVPTEEQKTALKNLAEEQNVTKIEQGLKRLAKDLSEKQAAKKLSDQGLGVVPPSMAKFPRLSITMRHAEQRSVISFGVFRKIGFGGNDKDRVAREFLAALGILGLAALHRDGGHLRSECDLVCERSNGWQIRRDDSPDELLSGITVERSLEVVQEALSRFPSSKLGFRKDPIDLQVHENLVAAMGRGES